MRKMRCIFYCVEPTDPDKVANAVKNANGGILRGKAGPSVMFLAFDSETRLRAFLDDCWTLFDSRDAKIIPVPLSSDFLG
ncbi:MAG: hypothetical protein LKG11_00785 [Bacilli bacterium]|nr:hypothetical protein [Bacilli bacterium]